MHAPGRHAGLPLALTLIAFAFGCASPGPFRPDLLAIRSGGAIASTPALPGPSIVESPRGDDDREVIVPGSLVETWVIHTRACDQVMGSNPWPALAVDRLDDPDGLIRGADPEDFLGRMAGRPTVILTHGYGYTHKEAVKEGVRVRAQLEALGGLTPGHLFVVFDWPSEREIPGLVRDLNEKARRSRIAGYHLARVLQASPEGSRLCLMGQSDGGRVTLTALHLLSGSPLRSYLREPEAQLSSGRADLRVRAVVLETAAEHDWLNPGNRLDGALPASEALLNLWNSRDYALAVYTLGRYTGFRAALGRVGLRRSDLEKLGPLADRVEQIDIHPMAGPDHSLFTQALTYPGVAGRIATYTSLD